MGFFFFFFLNFSSMYIYWLSSCQDRGRRVGHLPEPQDRDVQRVARTYFTPPNRLVLTLMPSGKPRAQ